jgi:hypothetical protein
MKQGKTEKAVFAKLSTQKVELSQHEVALNKISDISKLLQDGEDMLKNADSELSGIAKRMSNGLIVVAANVPAQAKNAMKLAEELGADNVIQDLKQILDKADALRKRYEPTYNNIK